MKLLTRIALELLLLSLPALLVAQTPLGERLGGVTTQFTIITDSLVILNDSEQLLIKRGVRDFNRDINGAYGYGYESIHLEFLADQPIENPGGRVPRANQRLRVRFFDPDMREIARMRLKAEAVTAVASTGLRVIYSIDLRGIPLPLLELTKAIDLAWEE